MVLAGPPNAGKSQLFNALVGEVRALVSPDAGTTRDYLSALCDCDGLTIELIDTAGVERATNPIGQRAQSMSVDQSARADLVLTCESIDSGPAHSAPVSRPTLRVWTKCDLAIAPEGSFATSARTGEGLSQLRERIATARSVSKRPTQSVPVGTAARCRESLVRAGQSLQAAAETILFGGGDELVAIDLRQAIDDLGKVVGGLRSPTISSTASSDGFCIEQVVKRSRLFF